jgi:hypothetical protein
MKKINCILVPNIGINDAVIGYTAIRFPIIEKDTQDLMDIDNPEITCNVDTKFDLFRYIEDGVPNLTPFNITETCHAPSFDKAIQWFNRMTRAG